MKKVFKIIATVVAVFVILAVGKNLVAKTSIEKAVGLLTGLKLQIRSLHVGILDSKIAINELALHNPRSFQDKIMLNLPEAYVDYNLSALLGGKAHLEEVRFNLQEFLIAKNAEGQLNLDYLRPAGAKKAADKPVKPTEPKPAGKTPQIRIDHLYLKIGRVVYKDYSGGGDPKVHTFDINIDEHYEDITDPNAIVPLLVAKVFMNTTIGRLAGVNPAEMLSKYSIEGMELSELGLEKFQGLAADAGSKARAAASTVKEKLPLEHAGDAGKALGDEVGAAADKAAKALTGLLGGSE